jgi:hypothetical protein
VQLNFDFRIFYLNVCCNLFHGFYLNAHTQKKRKNELFVYKNRKTK